MQKLSYYTNTYNAHKVSSGTETEAAALQQSVCGQHW